MPLAKGAVGLQRLNSQSSPFKIKGVQTLQTRKIKLCLKNLWERKLVPPERGVEKAQSNILSQKCKNTHAFEDDDTNPNVFIWFIFVYIGQNSFLFHMFYFGKWGGVSILSGLIRK